MATGAVQSSGPKKRVRPRWLGDVGTLVVIFGLLGSVYLLPTDSSFSELERSGRLNVCMPTLYPPLVTDDPAHPGFDKELLALIAQKLHVTLNVVPNAAMAKDFNPRSWRITRAQCQLVAGGIALTRPVLSYLDATDAYLSTGWAVVSPQPLDTLEGKTVGFFAGLTGLDRVALSRSLRASGVKARIVNTSAALAEGLRDGTYDAGISEALTARQIAGANDWTVEWVAGNEERYPIGIGLWKGDLTLKRQVVAALDALEADGSVAKLKAKYDLADIDFIQGSANEVAPALE